MTACVCESGMTKKGSQAHIWSLSCFTGNVRHTKKAFSHRDRITYIDKHIYTVSTDDRKEGRGKNKNEPKKVLSRDCPFIKRVPQSSLTVSTITTKATQWKACGWQYHFIVLLLIYIHQPT
jgi:hypothetical protein